MFSFASLFAVRPPCIRYTMQITAAAKKATAPKDGINKKLSETQNEFNEYHNKRNELLKQLKDWAI